MVKRLRRRPLTAESGVRFPMGVPKILHKCVGFSFTPRLIVRYTHATTLHEPQNTGLALHYVSELTCSAITLTMFTTIPHGGTNENPNRTHRLGLFFVLFQNYKCSKSNFLCIYSCKRLHYRKL